MNGIDIASYQAGIDLSKVPCDFVIIKATQGTSYVNPDLDRAYKQAVECGKKVGFYHYCSKGGIVNEARHFVDTVAGRPGILCVDWEKDSNDNWGNVDYCKELVKTIAKMSGRRPFLYMSKGVCRAYNWAGMGDYPLWVAQYANYTPTGYQSNPWTDKYGYGIWDKPAIFQYSSSGQLPGYSGRLDLDLCYLTPDQWDVYAGIDNKEETPFKPYAGTVSASWLRVRTGPGTEYPVVRHNDGEYQLEKGLCIAVIGERNGWCMIGPDRWVSGAFIAR